MEIEIDAEIVSQEPLTQEQQNLLQLAMIIQALVQTFKDLGYNVDEASKGAAKAIRAAWNTEEADEVES